MGLFPNLRIGKLSKVLDQPLGEFEINVALHDIGPVTDHPDVARHIPQIVPDAIELASANASADRRRIGQLGIGTVRSYRLFTLCVG